MENRSTFSSSKTGLGPANRTKKKRIMPICQGSGGATIGLALTDGGYDSRVRHRK
ncbi:hypothetical protein RSAG8_03596, partial [Rhizoctonia solani AG-8 WAC10335]